jgi:hypothetical protein
MRKALLTIQLAGLIASLTLLSLTVFGKAEIKRLASDFINKRIQPSVTELVNLVEMSERANPIGEKLNELRRKFRGERQVLREEIELYRKDPLSYLRSLTGSPATDPLTTVTPATDHESDRSEAAQKVDSWKAAIHRHFDRVFDRIILDLRIFATSNLIGFGLAFWLMHLRANIDLLPCVIISAILTAAILYSSMMYWDQNWFFTILLDSYMGLWYPLMLVLTFADYRRRFLKTRRNSKSDSAPA